MLLQMLLVWLAANFGPHVMVYLVTGKPYFALSPLQGLIAELSIMTLNLALPIVALAPWSHGHTLSLRRALAWHWNGWSTLGWGLVGLGLILSSMPVVNWLVGSAPFSYGGGIGTVSLRSPQGWALLLLLLFLWFVTTLGEEVMFRGYLQTALSERYGTLVGLLGAALLFSLRHTPADIYWGWGASAGQWISRLLQLAIGALVFGWIRHRSQSTVATWITHLLLWVSVIFISALNPS